MSYSLSVPRRDPRWPLLLQGLGSLLWLVQAWWLAAVVAALMAQATGSGPAADLPRLIGQAALLVAGLGVLRAGLEYAGTRITWLQARQGLSALRWQLAERLRASSPIDAQRPPSGQITGSGWSRPRRVLPWRARYQAGAVARADRGALYCPGGGVSQLAGGLAAADGGTADSAVHGHHRLACPGDQRGAAAIAG